MYIDDFRKIVKLISVLWLSDPTKFANFRTLGQIVYTDGKKYLALNDFSF